MALNFPSNPSENDIYQFGLLTYIFKNGKWVSQSRGASQLPWYSNMEQARALWKRLAAEAGLNLVDGSFEEGAEITSSSDVVWWQAGSAIYGWHLNEAKTVPVGSTPATSGGVGALLWVDRTDITLQANLAASTGAGLVGTTDGITVQAKLNAIDANKANTSDLAIKSNVILLPAIATTSGASIPLGSIPSWAKKITVQMVGVSTSATSALLIKLGVGGVAQSATYNSSGFYYSGQITAATTGFFAGIRGSAAGTIDGAITLTKQSDLSWTAQGYTHSANGGSVGGSCTLAGVVDSLFLTTVNGTDTFDAGSVSLLIEG